MMLNQVQKIGAATIGFTQRFGRAGLFLFYSLWGIPSLKAGMPLLLKQLYSVGVLSLVIIVVSGTFIGMVLALQGYTILSDFGTENALGQMVALSLVRELAPVVAALLFAGRAGSALTAEIGLMKTTEQLASIEMIGVDPLKHVIAPRLLAGFISMPILTAIFCAAGIWGGYLVGVQWLGLYEGAFWANMQNAVSFQHDVLNGILKGFVFGIAITWIAVFQGYESEPTSEGISVATTKTVVYSSLTILALDFILTAMMFGDF